mmetsp:Transcript_26253/g.37368  ORF Transcript_26253/g.37368 Transcript_26253/m.37368 type:complete len:1337 (-) Transcript_26253:2587-6597(-)
MDHVLDQETGFLVARIQRQPVQVDAQPPRRFRNAGKRHRRFQRRNFVLQNARGVFHLGFPRLLPQRLVDGRRTGSTSTYTGRHLPSLSHSTPLLLHFLFLLLLPQLFVLLLLLRQLFLRQLFLLVLFPQILLLVLFPQTLVLVLSFRFLVLQFLVLFLQHFLRARGFPVRKLPVVLQARGLSFRFRSPFAPLRSGAGSRVGKPSVSVQSRSPSEPGTASDFRSPSPTFRLRRLFGHLGTGQQSLASFAGRRRGRLLAAVLLASTRWRFPFLRRSGSLGSARFRGGAVRVHLDAHRTQVTLDQSSGQMHRRQPNRQHVVAVQPELQVPPIRCSWGSRGGSLSRVFLGHPGANPRRRCPLAPFFSSRREGSCFGSWQNFFDLGLPSDLAKTVHQRKLLKSFRSGARDVLQHFPTPNNLAEQNLDELFRVQSDVVLGVDLHEPFVGVALFEGEAKQVPDSVDGVSDVTLLSGRVEPVQLPLGQRGRNAVGGNEPHRRPGLHHVLLQPPVHKPQGRSQLSFVLDAHVLPEFANRQVFKEAQPQFVGNDHVAAVGQFAPQVPNLAVHGLRGHRSRPGTPRERNPVRGGGVFPNHAHQVSELQRHRRLAENAVLGQDPSPRQQQFPDVPEQPLPVLLPPRHLRPSSKLGRGLGRAQPLPDLVFGFVQRRHRNQFQLVGGKPAIEEHNFFLGVADAEILADRQVFEVLRRFAFQVPGFRRHDRLGDDADPGRRQVETVFHAAHAGGERVADVAPLFYAVPRHVGPEKIAPFGMGVHLLPDGPSERHDVVAVALGPRIGDVEQGCAPGSQIGLDVLGDPVPGVVQADADVPVPVFAVLVHQVLQLHRFAFPLQHIPVHVRGVAPAESCLCARSGAGAGAGAVGCRAGAAGCGELGQLETGHAVGQRQRSPFDLQVLVADEREVAEVADVVFVGPETGGAGAEQHRPQGSFPQRAVRFRAVRGDQNLHELPAGEPFFPARKPPRSRSEPRAQRLQGPRDEPAVVGRRQHARQQVHVQNRSLRRVAFSAARRGGVSGPFRGRQGQLVDRQHRVLHRRDGQAAVAEDVFANRHQFAGFDDGQLVPAVEQVGFVAVKIQVVRLCNCQVKLHGVARVRDEPVRHQRVLGQRRLPVHGHVVSTEQVPVHHVPHLQPTFQNKPVQRKGLAVPRHKVGSRVPVGPVLHQLQQLSVVERADGFRPGQNLADLDRDADLVRHDFGGRGCHRPGRFPSPFPQEALADPAGFGRLLVLSEPGPNVLHRPPVLKIGGFDDPVVHETCQLRLQPEKVVEVLGEQLLLVLGELHPRAFLRLRFPFRSSVGQRVDVQLSRLARIPVQHHRQVELTFKVLP